MPDTVFLVDVGHCVLSGGLRGRPWGLAVAVVGALRAEQEFAEQFVPEVDTHETRVVGDVHGPAGQGHADVDLAFAVADHAVRVDP
jgi:hypothetical protein